MHTPEQKTRSVKLNVKCGLKVTATIRELGYRVRAAVVEPDIRLDRSPLLLHAANGPPAPYAVQDSHRSPSWLELPDANNE